jgi:sec-independent protein translocase protein TatA
MALGDPLQWIVIGVIVIVIFLWGPQKIPDLAKALGRAKREFDEASHEMGTSITGVGSTASATAASVRPVTPDLSADQALVEAARGLGITTEGKTRAQISQEIIAKAKPQA